MKQFVYFIMFFILLFSVNATWDIVDWQLIDGETTLTFNSSANMSNSLVNSTGIGLYNTYNNYYIINASNDVVYYRTDIVKDFFFVEPYDLYLVRTLTNTAFDVSLSGYFRNVSAELGSDVLVSVIDLNETICIDITHPDYGVNYSCNSSDFNFNVSIDYFQKTTDNESRDLFNLTYTSGSLENQTFYISSHHYDEVINLTFNITAYQSSGSYPNDVKVYINDTLSNNIGSVEGTLRVFNDTSSEKTVTFTDEETQIAGYIKLPKTTTVTGANFNVSGYNYTYIQETAENQTQTATQPSSGIYEGYMYPYYEKKNRTFVAWDVRHGILPRYNITSLAGTCLTDNDEWLLFRMYSHDKGYSGDTSRSRPQCYDGTWNDIGTLSSSSDSRDSVTAVAELFFDNNYESSSCWKSIHPTSRWYHGSYSCTVSNQYGRIFEDSIWWNSYTRNPWIEVGALNGTRVWNYTSLFKTDYGKIDSITNRLNDYLTDCVADADGYCLVPIYVYSDIGGIIEISDLEINYSVDVINPIVLDSTILQSFLDDSNGEVNIPIKIESSENGIIEISDIKYDYSGGNSTIEYLAHSTDYLHNLSRNVIYHYSDFSISLPSHIESVFFIPTGPTSKNVQPFGQTVTNSIYTINHENYGGNMNLSVYLEPLETTNCIDGTLSNTSIKASGQLLDENIWYYFSVDKTTDDDTSLWMWADYACSYSTWSYWQPNLYFRGCCKNCDICSEDIE